MANPISKVYPVGGTPTAFNVVPSAYEYEIEDVSDSEAGRSEDGKMDKMRIGQVISINLGFDNISLSNCAYILQAFNPEYVMVEYLSAETGEYETDEFYVGNRKAPLYNYTKELWENVGFSIIKRSAD